MSTSQKKVITIKNELDKDESLFVFNEIREGNPSTRGGKVAITERDFLITTTVDSDNIPAIEIEIDVSTILSALIRFLTELSIPYKIEDVNDGETTNAKVFDGVRVFTLLFVGGKEFFPLEVATEVLHMLENNEEIRAIIRLNETIVRSDIENMPRLSKTIDIKEEVVDIAEDSSKQKS